MDEAGHGLTMFKDEGHVTPPHLKHGFCRCAKAEAGVEKPGIMGAELPYFRGDGRHLGSIGERDFYRLA